MSTVQFDVSGAMVCWDPADCLQHAARDAFLAAGFGDLAPKPRTDYEALKEALGELKGKDELVQRHRAHERHGCELVSVLRGEEVATLGTEEAIERRKTQAFRMRCLVERYSTILNDGLEGLKRAIGLAETAAVMAAMQAVAA